ncbi:hypothetical protein PMNALOAF_1369 [Methylobacterium adhaesivum]|jgi:hypothetical protein|uniref:Uncharacterized protein n=1 Tax=Methylobacterium adhaesivum TaxID=333297 RepID=A0ABT8BMI5_9HYPH|nr:hypothetical protein [Methylobacterium adhaesivum]MDN3592521.1 hypothetical protein [Methylobacterium adhaesivum]GJD30125.1 hypothetical protein PMNALOAF_1369 [Methylobacterium adhaesivum]
MRTRTCLLLAVATALLGLGLRRVVPVAPVDDTYRAVVQAYDPAKRP